MQKFSHHHCNFTIFIIADGLRAGRIITITLRVCSEDVKWRLWWGYIRLKTCLAHLIVYLLFDKFHLVEMPLGQNLSKRTKLEAYVILHFNFFDSSDLFCWLSVPGRNYHLWLASLVGDTNIEKCWFDYLSSLITFFSIEINIIVAALACSS